jgi:sugar/nucleoside kinase (ribokinase family)
VIFYADSRAYIHKFRNVIAKCNLKEITDIFGEKENLTKDCLFGLAERLFTMIHKPVYITLGEQGSIVYDGNRHKVDAVKVGGAIDSVGAGDACNAGIVFALVKGADYEQAALVGNVAASLVIRQIGQTGAARFEDVVAVLEGITSEKCF